MLPYLLIIATGIAVGVLVSAPVGPVNIICINRTMHHGFLSGLTTGLGAVVADGLLAAVAGFGIASISDMIVYHEQAVQLVGGIILLLFGLGVTLKSPPTVGEDGFEPKPSRPLRSVAGTFLITVTNPGAILGMLAIFGGIVGTPMVPEGDYAATGLLVVSVVGGALLWWTGIAALVSRVRHRFSQRTFKTINLTSGIALMAFGALILIRLAVLFVM